MGINKSMIIIAAIMALSCSSPLNSNAAVLFTSCAKPKNHWRGGSIGKGCKVKYARR